MVFVVRRFILAAVELSDRTPVVSQQGWRRYLQRTKEYFRLVLPSSMPHLPRRDPVGERKKVDEQVTSVKLKTTRTADAGLAPFSDANGSAQDEKEDARANLSPVATVVLLLCMFASAFITEIIGIHEIFGAFFFGVILPRRITHTMSEKVIHRQTFGIARPLTLRLD